MLQKTPKAITAEVAAPTVPVERVVITPPKIQRARIGAEGTAPFVSNKFSSFNRRAMMEKQMQGSQANKGKSRPPKDFERVFKSALHVSEEGWYGIPAAAFRNGMISACRLVGYKMTIAKMSLFVAHQGLDADDGTPLVRIIGPEPVRRDVPVRLADGSTDILARPFFMKWKVTLDLEWDADQFSASDVVNLIARVGLQVGVGAGRHDSRSSSGMGWGTFKVQA
jgi:hypothetical protein